MFATNATFSIDNYVFVLFRVMKVAKKLKDDGVTAYFGVSSKDEMRQEMEECGLGAVSGDKPVVCIYDAKNQKFNFKDDFTYVYTDVYNADCCLTVVLNILWESKV